MKTLKLMMMVLVVIVMISNYTSCVVIYRHDNGKHNGWYKHHHSWHFPNRPIIINPGYQHGKPH